MLAVFDVGPVNPLQTLAAVEVGAVKIMPVRLLAKETSHCYLYASRTPPLSTCSGYGWFWHATG